MNLSVRGGPSVRASTGNVLWGVGVLFILAIVVGIGTIVAGRGVLQQPRKGGLVAAHTFANRTQPKRS